MRTFTRMFAAFTYRDFRVQWFGACTSSIGTWMQLVAQNWLVLSLTHSPFFTGVAQSFGGPAYQALIPSLVDKKDLPNAVALNSIQFNLARVLGPLLFAATLAAFTQWGYAEPQAMNACFALNSLSFLVVINTLMMLHVKHIPPATT